MGQTSSRPDNGASESVHSISAPFAMSGIAPYETPAQRRNHGQDVPGAMSLTAADYRLCRYCESESGRGCGCPDDIRQWIPPIKLPRPSDGAISDARIEIGYRRLQVELELDGAQSKHIVPPLNIFSALPTIQYLRFQSPELDIDWDALWLRVRLQHRKWELHLARRLYALLPGWYVEIAEATDVSSAVFHPFTFFRCQSCDLRDIKQAKDAMDRVAQYLHPEGTASALSEVCPIAIPPRLAPSMGALDVVNHHSCSDMTLDNILFDDVSATVICCVLQRDRFSPSQAMTEERVCEACDERLALLEMPAHLLYHMWFIGSPLSLPGQRATVQRLLQGTERLSPQFLASYLRGIRYLPS